MRLALLLLITLHTTGSLQAGDDWWQFRGPEGNGHAHTIKLPLKWSERENIVWKTAIHDRGWSSPVIWRNQIWLTTSTGNGHHLFAVCVNRETGKISHDIHVFDVDRPQNISAENTYASPTPVVEDERVYVHYGTYGTVCLDSATGTIIWIRRDLKCDHESGAGPNSSPFIMGNLFVVNVDGRDVQYVIALDKTNGKTVWKTDRSVDYSKIPIHQRKAYNMPILIPRENDNQLVSPGAQAIYSYDPDTGNELWKVRHSGWSIAPRPVYGMGMVFVVMDYDHPELWAVRPDGTGDVTNSHVKWREKRGIPARSSPLYVNDLLFLVNRHGIASCLEAESGKLVWKSRIEGKYSASPIYTNGRIYFFNENGVSTVIKSARKFEVLSVNRLAEEQLMASPAVAGQSLFIRTEKHLYRIKEFSSK
ncbi:MAG: PQQ-binding-like beta-propeller repeat protein [Pirellulales bacterium]